MTSVMVDRLASKQDKSFFSFKKNSLSWFIPPSSSSVMKLRTRSSAGMKVVEVVEVEKESRSEGFQAPQARDSVTSLSSAFSTILGPFFPGRKLTSSNFMRAKSPTSGELTPPFVEAKERDRLQREARLGGKGEGKSQEQTSGESEKIQASDQNGMAAVDTEDKCYLPAEEAEKKQASEQHGMAAGDKGGYATDQGRVKCSETPPNLSTRTPVIMGPPVLPKIYVNKGTSHCRGSDKKRKALSAPVLHTRKFDMFEGSRGSTVLKSY